MKKMISILLALCLSVMLLPAVAEDDVTGMWYLTRARASGVNMVVISDEITITVNFRADGTAELYSKYPGSDEERMECTWTFDGSEISFIEGESGEVETAKYENGELTMEAEGATMILTREQYTPYVMSPAVKAESIEAFYGTWVPSVSFQYGMMSSMDDVLPPEQRAKLAISAEGMQETSSDGTVSVYQNPAVDPETGVLTASFTVEGITATMELTLLEDGTMLMTASFMGVELARTIYARLAAAEDAA